MSYLRWSKTRKIQLTVVVIALAVLCMQLASCALSKRARNVEYSGFLGNDYALLQAGDQEQAQERYVKPGVNWAVYNKILLDPVTIWRGRESSKEGLSLAEARKLVDYFYGLIYHKFVQRYQLVRASEPDTLRVQVAITKLGESHVVMDVVSTVVPQFRATSSLYGLVTGKPAFVGSAAIELRVADAETGELLGLGVSHRVGGKTLNAESLNSWGDVENIMRYWVDHAYYNLCELQKRDDCIKPKERRGFL